MSTVVEPQILTFSREEKDIEIANTIVKQILDNDITALGVIDCRVQQRYTLEKGVLFHRVIVKTGEQRSTRGNIKITLNWQDLYDVVIYSTDRFGLEKKVLKRYESIFADSLSAILRKI